MATFTTKAPGLWFSAGQTTWNQSGVPGSGDTVTINHAITGDANITIDGIALNATLTMAAAKVLTLQGNVTQGNAAFILSAGAGLVFSTTGGDRTWTTGSGNSQASCKIVANGTTGAHCTISKIGSGNAVFNADPAFLNCGGWELTYCDMTGIHNAAYTYAIGSNDFGIHHRRLLFCTFNDCGPLFLAQPYQWGATDKDFRIEDCNFSNVPRGTLQIYQRTNAAGSGTRTCLRNSFSDQVDIALQPTDLIDYNYFGNCGTFIGTLGSHNFARYISRLGSPIFYSGLTNFYILADFYDPADPILGINEIGNPHFWNTSTQSTVNTGVVLEYPHDFQIDGGDGHYSTSASPDNVVMRRCISLPSMTDDGYSTNILALAGPTVNAILQHCTVVGRGANVTATERDHAGTTCVSQFESNLIVGWGFGNERAIGGAFDYASGVINILPGLYPELDVVPASAVKNNDTYYPSPANYGSDTSGLVREGWAIRMTDPVDATNRNYSSGSPGFVDITRCAATYAVNQGWASALPTRPALPVNRANASWIAWFTAKRAALDAFHAGLMADPTRGTAAYTWITAGFVPTNTALDPSVLANQAVDGLTRGAMEFSGTGGIPDPPAPGRTGRLGKGGAGRPRHS